MFDLTDGAAASIEAREVSVTYRNGMQALQRANFSIPFNTITALVGVNGSGKSTLFKSLMGFVKLDSGQVLIAGQSVRDAQRQNLVSYVPQSDSIDWNFPVRVEDVVMMGRYGHMRLPRWPGKRDRQAVYEALARVDMEEMSKRQIGELSGGQKKRVFIARALAQESKVMLLDEPFTGVDVNSEESIMGLLRNLRSDGMGILVATHNLGTVPEYCDRTLLINRTIIAGGLTQDVFNQENLSKAFGGMLRRVTLTSEILHIDPDPRQVTVITDDERALVMYDEGR